MPEPEEIRVARRSLERLMGERGRLLEQARHAEGERLDRRAVRGVDDRIRDVLEELHRRRGALDADPDVPLVLLPVRLETRFGTRDGSPVLRVRVYPDDVHVDGLERGLTEAEHAAGQAWWRAAWADGEGADRVREDAFVTLVAAVGPDRAEWVAHATTPTNLAQRPGAAPAFPDRLPPLGRGPVARGLPDRFVALAVQGGTVSRGVGRPVPPDLPVSPVPTVDGLAPAPADPDTLGVAEGAEWLTDHAAALEVGMALEVPLQGGRARVDRLVVMGTRSTAEGQDAAAELEDLLTGHRFGAGLGLLAQGTPTNNADADRSPYRPRRAPVAPPVTVPAAAPAGDTTALASVLGVDAALLTGLVGEGTGEQALAGRVTTALWGAGWGAYLKTLDDRDVPGVTATSRQRVRRLAGAHVRGRGPAPALRVGAQPYGVLPVSDLRAWRPEAGEDGAGVASVVRRLLDPWLWSARRVPVVRPGQGDVADLLLEVMGSSPVMQHLRVRPEVDEGAVPAAGAATGVKQHVYDWERRLTAAVAAPLLGVDAARLSLGSLDEDDRPLPLPLVSARDDEFVTALLGSPSRVLAVDSVLQALLHLSWEHAQQEVDQVSPVEVLPELVTAGTLDRRLSEEVTSVVRRVGAGDVEPEVLFALADRVADAGEREAMASRLGAYSPAAAVSTSLADVALSAVEGREAGVVATTVVGEWLQRAGYRSELRAALTGLVGTDLEARRLAVAEALDLASHRLDAWASGVVAERRARQAAGRPRGLTLGAWGVVEDLDPGGGGASHGWLHAPSPEHAVAAGMLRSAHLGHRGDDGAGPFALDLSSTRVRAADHVLEGVRSGQQPAALVGYQLERDLVSAGLGRFQLSLRTIAPLVARRLSDRPGTPGTDPQAAQESVAATDVVDALLLLTRFPVTDAAAMQRLRQRLDVPPENAYLPPGGWDPVSAEEWDGITAALARAADTVDAVADVLLAESVLQHASGNPGRAAAAMDVLGAGGPVGDALDVLEAHDSGRRLTHAALVLLGPDVSTAWSSSTPRALAEPRLEAWASAQLGPPEDVLVATVDGREVTLAGAGLSALDVVLTDGSALAAGLRATVPDLAAAALTLDVEGSPSAPSPPGRTGLREVLAQAVSLRALVAGAEPALPAHLERAHERLPEEPPARDLAASLGELRARVETLADGLAAVVADLTARLAGLPEDGVLADRATAEAMVAAVHALDAYGIPLAGGHPHRPLDLSWVRAALQAAEARSVDAQASVARLGERVSTGASPSDVLEAAQDVATGVLGDGFVVLPLLVPGGGPDPLVAAVGEPAFAAPPASAVRRFVQDHATVRAGLRRWSETRLLGEALGHARPWTVAQLADRGPDGPAPGTDRWLAGPLPPEGPWPDGPVTHLVLEVHGTPAADQPLAGLVVDGWVEDLPDQPGTQADPADPQPGRVRTGLAVHTDAASARPPQVVLCAVSPDGSRWSEASVRAVVESTLALARTRMVTLERLSGQARVLPALYVRHDQLQGSRFLRWTELAEIDRDLSVAHFVKDA